MPKKTKIGPEIQRIRKKHNVTQERLSELLGLKRTNLSALENSDKEPTTCWRNLLRYIDEYGVDILERK